jgi:NADH:ubiquinone oxidoreductase subunit K
VKTLPHKRLSAQSYLATLCAVHLVFIVLYLISVFEIQFEKMLIVQLASLLLILLSTAILFIKNSGDPAAQTFRFLIISVVQLLGYLSVSLALIYTDQDAVLVLYLLGLSLSILILQTSYFVRRLK